MKAPEGFSFPGPGAWGSRRRITIVLQSAIVLVALSTFVLLYHRLDRRSPPSIPERITATANVPPPPPDGPTAPTPDIISAYIDAILRPEATHLPRMQCPDLSHSAARYAHLIPPPPASNTTTPPPIHYFFALDLRNVLPLLPRLLGSILETIRFLGPSSCFLSIIEGNSPDGTLSVLSALTDPLAALGTRYHLHSTPLDPSESDRIPRLAALRNLALEPLLANPSLFAVNDTTILFLNDVAICPEDILELAHQRRAQRAHMTCAMDWTYAGPQPTFYDVWVARTVRGDSFFDIPPSGSWDLAWDLFWNDPGTKARFVAHQPFQVFSCWNGAVAVGAEVLLEGGVRFRGPREDRGECMQGEPQLFCKDMWAGGWGRVAVVPSVNLEYGDEKGRRIKEGKGYTSGWTAKERDGEGMIEWADEPPERVRCMPHFDQQFWQAWNASLGED